MRPRSPLRLVAATLAALTLAGSVGVPAGAQDPTPGAASPAPAVLSALALPADAELAADAALTPPVDQDVTDPAMIDLAVITTRLTEAIEGLPEADWTIEDLAAAMDFDPVLPFAFVRDRIGYQPYAGVLRGAAGTLAARAGNSWDRALLLQALLRAMLIPTRLAWGDLDPATTATLVGRGLEAPPTTVDAAQLPLVTGISLDAVGTRARRDHAVLRAALGDRLATFGGDEAAQAAREAGHHAWVQALIGPDWVDLDPSLPDTAVGQTLTTIVATAAAPPAEARQTVTIRVITEHLDETSGQLTESVVLDQALDVADTLGQVVALTFTPSSSQLGGTIATLFSGVARWRPILGIADRQLEGSDFDAGGTGTDLFGDAVTAPQLTAIRLELVSSGPDREPQTASTLLLDRVLPADRAAGTLTKDALLPMAGDATGPAALSRITHVLISAGGFSARDHLDELGYGFAYANDVLLDPVLAERQQLSDLLRPLMALDDNLIGASELVSVPALRDPGRIGAYVATPRVFLTTFGPSEVPDQLLLRDDLALDGVRLLADPSVPAADVTARRIWYGALQSAIETELVRDRAVGGDDAQTVLAAASYTTTGPMDILDATSVAARTDLPAALLDGVAAGGMAIIPAGADPVVTWWAIGPDGTTTAMLAPTFGGSAGGFTPGGGRYRGVRQKPPVPRPQSRGSGVVDISKPPKGPRNVPVGSSCRGGSEYTAILSCVSIPGALVFRIVLATAIDAVIFAVIYGAFKAVEYSAGN